MPGKPSPGRKGQESTGCIKGFLLVQSEVIRTIDLWFWSTDTGRVATVLPVRIQEDRLDDKGSDLRSFKLDKDTPAG